MISKPVVLGLMAAACVTAAAGGAYVAVRQNNAAATFPVTPAVTSQAAPARPVAETEAIVAPAPVVEREAPVSTAGTAKATTAPRSVQRSAGAPAVRSARTGAPPVTRTPRPEVERSAPRAADVPSEAPSASERPASTRDPLYTPAPVVAAVPALPEPVTPEPPAPVRPQFVEVIVPAASVVGLKVETPITSETARVEDRVEARVTRDVIADGRVAIPAGTRVVGDVTEVERGGKMKGKARLGVRFHTLVLADGSHVSLRTDSIFREGSSPGAESARKIGGAAIGGAVLGAIMGGAKGAAIGGATGAAGGSAVVMSGDRNAATLPGGTIVTVRLTSPVAVDVEKDPH